MPKQRFGLGRHIDVGRGIDALIPGATRVSDDSALDTSLSSSALYEIPVSAVVPNPQQPRASVEDDAKLLELAASIQTYGLLQPLIVAPLDDDEDSQDQPRYQLIAGERRWRAAQIAGVDSVPAVIRGATPQLMLEIALVENLQRADLNPIEEATAYASLMEDYHLTQEQIAERVGRDRVTVTNKLRLMQLPKDVQDALIEMPKAFTEGHARAVLQINGEEERINAMKLIVAQGMSVRGAEELARRVNAAALSLPSDRRGGAARPQSYDTQVLEQEFIRAIEMKARLQRSTKGKGSLTLYFSNEDQLQLLYDRLVGSGYPGGSGALNGSNGAGQSYDFGSLDSIGGLLDDGLTSDGEPGADD
ncbi:MAG TPA: ParB/RepB/Spo0J family partition protein [Ktedonobacterales bacterium]|nr:ParB/RepB/Spo0J family partition protein [Ktedonobacterales bacterium]